MPLVSGVIPNLLGGVSQQPFILRHPTQLDRQENMLSSVVEGLRKRPPLEYHADLGTGIITSHNQAAFHWIDRDSSERYMVIIKDGDLQVYDLINNEFKTVNAPHHFDYLNIVGTPRTTFKAVTVADYTFIVNTEMEVEADKSKATGTITFSGNPTDGQIITIGDGVREVVFEFDDNAAITGGRTAVTIGANGAATATALAAAIEASDLLIDVEDDLAGELALENQTGGTIGNDTITENASNVAVTGMSGGGSAVLSSEGNKRAILNILQGAFACTYEVVSEEDGLLATYTTSDPTNDKATGSITQTGQPTDGEFIRISDGALTKEFEFDDDASVVSGRVSVTIGATAGDTLTNLRQAILAGGQLFSLGAISGGAFTITNNNPGVGDIDIFENATNYAVTGMSGANDSSTVKTEVIAEELRSQINGVAGWAATRVGNSIAIAKDSGAVYTDLTVKDSIGGNGMLLNQKVVQDFTHLAPFGRTDVKIEVTGDPGTRFDNFYVISDSVIEGESNAQLEWEETVGPGIPFRLNSSTLPHTLIRESDGTFTFDRATYANREAGDETTNPWPTFVNSTINDVVFFKNRLGFFSGENIILSQVGDYFNFFRSTVTTQLDDDPIDTAVSTNQVAILHHAALVDGRLIAISDKLQFELKGDPLTPASAALVNISRYSAHPDIPPVVGGTGVFFSFDRGADFTGIRELVRDRDGDKTSDITAHVPHLIEGNVLSMTHSTQENMLFILTDTSNRRNIYVYQYFWEDKADGRERIQSAWHKWVMPNDMLTLQVIDEYLYAVVFDNNSDWMWLMKVDLRAGITETDWDWHIHLDFKIAGDHADVSRAFAGGDTTFTLPWHKQTGTFLLKVVDETGALLTPTSFDQTTGEVVFEDQDLAAAGLTFGLTYNGIVYFSHPVLRRPKGDSLVPLTEGDLTLLFWSLNFVDSGWFRLRITHPDGSVRRYTYAGPLFDEPAATGLLRSGRLKGTVRMVSGTTGLIIEVFNDTHYPSSFANAGWEGNYQLRSQQI